MALDLLTGIFYGKVVKRMSFTKKNGYYKSESLPLHESFSPKGMALTKGSGLS